MPEAWKAFKGVPTSSQAWRGSLVVWVKLQSHTSAIASHPVTMNWFLFFPKAAIVNR